MNRRQFLISGTLTFVLGLVQRRARAILPPAPPTPPSQPDGWAIPWAIPWAIGATPPAPTANTAYLPLVQRDVE